jgi:hypothetical protein
MSKHIEVNETEYGFKIFREQNYSNLKLNRR